MTQEPVVAARGVIRRAEIPLLAHYGTSHALFDKWITNYDCVLISDIYRLGEYVGDHVWVFGSRQLTVGDHLDAWLYDTARYQVRESTFNRYEQ